MVHFYIQNSDNFYCGIMKIEVTFDRTAKQQFKEQCIRRLRNFVEDIKKQEPHYKG
jgi:hypothetical protein